MTRARYAVRAVSALIIILCVFVTTAQAQARGNGRINGKIVDDQGKPAQNVQVRAVRAGESLILEAKTNDKGEWTIQGMAPGKWNFEFLSEGFEPQRMEVEIAENRNPPIDMKLTRAAAVDPQAELQAEMQKAAALQKEGKSTEARQVVEAVIAKYPAAYRLNAFIAGTYEMEKNYDKAIEHLKIVIDKEPADIDMKLFLAELYSGKGDKAEAQRVLDGIDMAQVKDATIFINQAINYINAGQTDEAVALLDKLAKQFPTRADLHYYRGRANIRGKKYAEARADLEKFVSLAAPDAKELADAKKLLEQLKDAK